jgi:hypothetical protein
VDWYVHSKWIRLALLILGSLFVRTWPFAAAAPEVREQHRKECFELRSSPNGPSVGFASLQRTDTPLGRQLEWQIQFPEQQLRIWHVETNSPTERRWVWREQQPRRGRSVTAVDDGESLEVTEWGRAFAWRKQMASAAPSSFPLELAEQVRAGALAPGHYALFDPLANAMESVQLVLSTRAIEASAVAEAHPGEALRQADFVREDGSLAASWTFKGSELHSFRWQRGDLYAVRIADESLERSAQVATLPQLETVVDVTGH